VGTSIGVAFSNGINETPESLVGRADRKLYQAKSGGRGRFSSAADKRAA
jgi:PleD family two-component response regulator